MLSLAVLAATPACQDDGGTADTSAPAGEATGSESSSTTDATQTSSETDATDTDMTDMDMTDTGTTTDETTTDTDNPPPPDVPELSLAIEPIKQFVFSWEPLPEADLYRLYERPDPDGEFTQISGDLPAPMHALTVPLHLRPNASYQLEACNDGGCTASAPVDVTGNLAEAIGYFKASNTGADDEFGTSVALSGDGRVMVVGAPGESSDAAGVGGEPSDDAPGSGAVYVFELSDGAWTQQAFIKASNTGADDGFGVAVALSSDAATLVVGASEEDSAAIGVGGDQGDGSSDSGAAYVFVREGESWTQQAYLKASNTGADDHFGNALAISASGDTLAVGASLEGSSAVGVDGDGANDDSPFAGAVYVFTRSGESWSQEAYIKASNTGADDRFGYALALDDSGDVLAVGARFESSAGAGVDADPDDDSADSAGAAYMFTRAGGAWSQQAYIKASNAEGGDFFGHALALSADGSTLAVGAIREDGDSSGVGGDPSSNALSRSGAAYVFRYVDDSWSQEAYIKATLPATKTNYGSSVSLDASGDLLVVGCPQENGGGDGINDPGGDSIDFAGAAFVLTREGDTWSTGAYLKTPIPAQCVVEACTHFGAALDMSDDGGTLVVGAYGDPSGSVGVGGEPDDDSQPHAGAVYSF